MRDVNGWMVGALGAVALVGAFYLGGRAAAAPGTTAEAGVAAAAPVAAAPGGVEFGCEPGQRVVMREATATSAASMTCVTAPAAALAPAAMGGLTAPAAMPVAYNGPAPYAQRTVNTGTIEEYRPRSVPVSYPSDRDVRRPVRTKTKSAVIIGSSAAIGATIGGLTKGTKGAVIGGIVGGGAATVWDQVTRRRDGGR
jgi:hypothetical protein